MKKFLILTLAILFIFVSALKAQAQEQEQYELSALVLPNFIDTRCFFDFTRCDTSVSLPRCQPIKPIKAIWVLNELFVNRVGSVAGPTSCKGEICWSWKPLSTNQDKSLYEQQIFSSNLPIIIQYTNRLSQSVSKTIKNTTGLRKSASSLVNASQDFISSSFTAGKDRGITKERSITQSETREKAITTNITPLFHMFLAKGLQGVFVNNALYPFCYASAVDLFWKFYEQGKVDDLIHAFVLYITVKPQDLELSASKNITQIERAKLLYTLPNFDHSNERAKDYAWAQAVLFSQLLELEDFKSVREFTDKKLREAVAKYEVVIQKTAYELKDSDNTLSIAKFFFNKHIQDELQKQSSKDNNATIIIEDFYAKAAVNSIAYKATEEELKEFNKALQNNDPLLHKNFYVPKKRISPLLVVLGLGVAISGVISGILLFKRIKKKKNTTT